MPYVLIENFSAGVDRRRPIYAAAPGSLYSAINCHLTRGGDVEKRLAFVPQYALPADTFGMWAIGDTIYVFGSASTPSMPSGVTYQRLQHPDGLAMTELVHAETFDAKVYAIARYSDDSVMHFFNGALITDWVDGVVRSAMTNIDGIAEHMKEVVRRDPRYIATRSTNVVTVTATVPGVDFTASASAVNGSTLDDQAITVATATANVTGTEVLSRGTLRIVGGTESAGVNKITAVTVNGVDVLGAAVDWVSSNQETARRVARQINEYTSVPDYHATASGTDGTVTIYALPGTGTGPNGYVVAATVAGDAAYVVTSNMASGAAGTASTAKQVTFTLLGTFQVGDLYTFTIGGVVYGNSGNPPSRGTFVRTHKGKLYSPGGSVLNFSGVSTAIGWTDPEDIGAGFINVSNEDSDAKIVNAAASFFGGLAVFAETAIQIWSMDDDPDLNVHTQTLNRTGTKFPRSVQPFGDSDVFYLSQTGMRSLRTKLATNAAYTDDVGTLIDTLINSEAKALTAAQRKKVVSFIDQTDGRLWLAIGAKIFIFSYFPGSKISGWTWYEPDFEAEWFAETTSVRGPYVRAGNAIYLYGGTNGSTYDASTASIQLPFMDAKRAADLKQWIGQDNAATGLWDCSWLTNPRDLNEKVFIGALDGYTLNDDNVLGVGHFTKVAPLLTCMDASAASISQIALHHYLAETDAQS